MISSVLISSIASFIEEEDLTIEEVLIEIRSAFESTSFNL